MGNPRLRDHSHQSARTGEAADARERDHEPPINEISFNSSLMREMRAIAFVTKLIDDGKILDNSMKRMLIHGASKPPTSWPSWVSSTGSMQTGTT